MTNTNNNTHITQIAEYNSRVCIVDDHPTTLKVLSTILLNDENYLIEAFSDPHKAMDQCYNVEFDLILVDYMMPKINGIEFIKQLRKNERYSNVPMVMLTSDNERELRLEAIGAGATDFLNKPIDPNELRLRMRNLANLRAAQVLLENRSAQLSLEVLKATREIIEREEEVIWRLARAIELRDGNTGNHISRVANFARIIAQQLGLDNETCRNIFLATPLHDIGKIGTPDTILLKTGQLDKDELKTMRQHTSIGGVLLENGRSELVRIAHQIAVSHHEKWDGTGYAIGLAGEDIPLPGRIVAIADVFDALCSERPYKRAWSPAEARAEILAQSGKHFDPKCVMAFSEAWPEIMKCYNSAQS